MWPLRQKNRQRRLEFRRNQPNGEPSLWQRFRSAGGVPSIGLAAVFFACAFMMDAFPVDPLPYRVDQYVGRDIYARVSFRVPSPRNMEVAKEKARRFTPATFTLDSQLLDEITSSLTAMPNRLKATSQPANEPELQKKLQLNAQSLQAWQALSKEPARGQYLRILEQFRGNLMQKPIVADEDAQAQRQRGANQVLLVASSKTLTRNVDEMVPLGKSGPTIAQLAQPFNDLDVPNAKLLGDGIASYVGSLLEPPQAGAGSPEATATKRPLYLYDPVTTQGEIEARLAEMDRNPPNETYEVFDVRDLLIRGGHTLTQQEIVLLQAEHNQWHLQQRQGNPLYNLGRLAGRFVLLLLVTGTFCFYIATYEKRIVRDHWDGAAVLATALLMLVITKLLMFSAYSEYVAVLTVVMAAVIFAIAYNQRFALAAAGFLALLTVLQLRGDFGRLLVLMAGAGTAVLMLRDIRSRSKLMEVGAAAAGVVFVTVCAMGASASAPWMPTLKSAVGVAIAAMLVGFLVWGMLPLIERIFRVTTSMTLLELCDASHPLLRRLAMDAPGTFNHSLQLGAMCEAAADAIGARGLLARAGAYFHDIGKTNKPEYFIENQGNMPNPHSKLSPAMSLLIIIGHVKDGLELVREYGLPSSLREFIASHHGTTLVQYFYHAATEQRKADVDRAPDEVEFRYPGPKPRSKEVAILMLADASESSVRAMGDPTPGRIENQVHIMVNRRLMDGQLDECDLTLREVHLIEASLIRSLCGMYHGRIAYPKPGGSRPAAPAEIKANDKADNRNGKVTEQGIDSTDETVSPQVDASAEADAEAVIQAPPPKDGTNDRIEQSQDQ